MTKLSELRKKLSKQYSKTSTIHNLHFEQKCPICGSKLIELCAEHEIVCPKCGTVIAFNSFCNELQFVKSRSEKKILSPYEMFKELKERPKKIVTEVLMILLTFPEVREFLGISYDELIKNYEVLLKKLPKMNWYVKVPQPFAIKFKMLFGLQYEKLMHYLPLLYLIKILLKGEEKPSSLIEEKNFIVNGELYKIKVYRVKSNIIYSNTIQYQVHIYKNGKRIPTYEAPKEIILYLKKKGYLKY